MNDKLSDFDFDYDSSGNSVSDFYFIEHMILILVMMLIFLPSYDVISEDLDDLYDIYVINRNKDD